MKTLPSLAITSITIIASSCTPIKSAADMRLKMAGEIAPPEGLRTVWNTSTPLELGYIYYKRKDASKGGYVLSSRYERFVEQTNSANYRLVSKSHATWDKEINTSFAIKPQLKYMGFGADPKFSNTKKIKFSAKGDEVHEIKQFISYVSEVLNSPGTGIELRKKVYEDTQRIQKEELPVSEARYWIVTNMMTMKDISIDFSSKPKTSIDVEVADVQALQDFLQVSGLTVSGSAGAETESDNGSTIKPTSPIGLIAWCVPLTATKVNGKIVMAVEEDHPIPVANTLR